VDRRFLYEGFEKEVVDTLINKRWARSKLGLYNQEVGDSFKTIYMDGVTPFFRTRTKIYRLPLKGEGQYKFLMLLGIL
jgi:hypothetical protein